VWPSVRRSALVLWNREPEDELQLSSELALAWALAEWLLLAQCRRPALAQAVLRLVAFLLRLPSCSASLSQWAWLGRC
jgi:hypothetical protein